MSKVISLTEEQKKLFSDAFIGANQAAVKVQEAVDLANIRRKAFEDLVSMYCSLNNLDKNKVKVDPQTWTILCEE